VVPAQGEPKGSDTTDLFACTERLTAARTEISGLNSRYQQQAQDLANLQIKFADSQKAFEQEHALSQTLQKSLGSAQSQIADNTKALQDLRSRAETAELAASQARSQLTAATQGAEDARNDKERLSKQLASLSTQLNTEQNIDARRREELGRQQNAIKEQLKASEEALEKANQTVAAQQEQVKAAEKQAQDARASRDEKSVTRAEQATALVDVTQNKNQLANRVTLIIAILFAVSVGGIGNALFTGFRGLRAKYIQRRTLYIGIAIKRRALNGPDDLSVNECEILEALALNSVTYPEMRRTLERSLWMSLFTMFCIVLYCVYAVVTDGGITFDAAKQLFSGTVVSLSAAVLSPLVVLFTVTATIEQRLGERRKEAHERQLA
jgi:hypothetical protein